MPTELEKARNELTAAERRVEALSTAVSELDIDSDLDGVQRLADQLAVAEARRDTLKAKVAELESDEARAAEEAEAEDRAGLLRIYDENGGKIAHLPAALRRKVLAAHRDRGEAQLLRGQRNGLPG